MSYFPIPIPSGFKGMTFAGIQYEQVKYNKGVRVPDSWGVLDCDFQFTILSPLSYDGPQL